MKEVQCPIILKDDQFRVPEGLHDYKTKERKRNWGSRAPQLYCRFPFSQNCYVCQVDKGLSPKTAKMWGIQAFQDHPLNLSQLSCALQTECYIVNSVMILILDLCYGILM